VRLLLEFKASTSSRTNKLQTPLMFASSDKVVDAMVAAGADVHAVSRVACCVVLRCVLQWTRVCLPVCTCQVDMSHQTPLFHARNGDVAAALLRHGADINARDKNGQLALGHARSGGVVEAILDFARRGSKPAQPAAAAAVVASAAARAVSVPPGVSADSAPAASRSASAGDNSPIPLAPPMGPLAFDIDARDKQGCTSLMVVAARRWVPVKKHKLTPAAAAVAAVAAAADPGSRSPTLKGKQPSGDGQKPSELKLESKGSDGKADGKADGKSPVKLAKTDSRERAKSGAADSAASGLETDSEPVVQFDQEALDDMRNDVTTVTTDVVRLQLLDLVLR
jgi:hypothetical protein